MPETVRMASPHDIDKLVSVRFDYFAAEGWEISREQREVIETNLRQYFANYLNTDFFAALVEVDGTIAAVAFLAISAKPANLSFPTGKTGTVLNVLTYPEHRKRGYATRAMQALIDEARRQNLSYIELTASESGKPLYQKLGFELSKPYPHFTDMKLPLR